MSAAATTALLATVAGVLLPSPVPARLPGPPLVHVVGLYRVLAPDVDEPWRYATSDEDLAFTLLPGEAVEVALWGSCRLDGGLEQRAGIVTLGRCAP